MWYIAASSQFYTPTYMVAQAQSPYYRYVYICSHSDTTIPDCVKALMIRFPQIGDADRIDITMCRVLVEKYLICIRQNGEKFEILEVA